MAQSVEHVIGNDEVISSILITSSKNPKAFAFGFFICVRIGGHNLIGRSPMRLHCVQTERNCVKYFRKRKKPGTGCKPCIELPEDDFRAARQKLLGNIRGIFGKKSDSNGFSPITKRIFLKKVKKIRQGYLTNGGSYGII